MLLSLWYSDSMLNAFFFNFWDEKRYRKKPLILHGWQSREQKIRGIRKWELLLALGLPWWALHYNTRYSYLVTHPNTNPDKKGLPLLRGRNMLGCLWYSNSTLNVFLNAIAYQWSRCIKGMVFWRHKCHLVRLHLCCQPRWINAVIVSYINFPFLVKFRFPVIIRESTRRCNTVENIRIHKVIGPFRKTALSCPRNWGNLCVFIKINSGTCRSNSPQFSRLLIFQNI